MSTRAIKKLTKATHESDSKLEDASGNEQDDQSETEAEKPGNRFAMLEAADAENDEADSANNNQAPGSDDVSKQRKKKQKKKSKNKAKSDPAAAKEATQDDEIQRILDSLNEKELPNAGGDPKSRLASSSVGGDFRRSRTTETELYSIEYRHLNAENELKRIFGAATTKLFSSDSTAGERRFAGALSKSRQQAGVGGGKLVIPKTTWPNFGKTGLSMKLVENRAGGVNVFAFEHGPVYRQAQFEFWEAVEFMNPDAFVEILRNNPYHVDTLLQLSEVVRMQEDFQTARDLIERAVYGCQAAFHPLFNVASATCRLDYRQRENRPFFLALFKHTQSLCQRACIRTALEFCKLIYSLDPDEDPLCMLLIIDYLALRSKQYDYLIDFYHVLEAKRNLSQLPNFCYSVALAAFLKAMEDGPASASITDTDALLAEADDLLRRAAAKFPTTLPAILEKCEVDADDVKRCGAFSAYDQSKDGVGLKQLSVLYAARTFQLWKDARVMPWLESNVRAILPQLDDAASSTPLSTENQEKRGDDYGALFLEFREHRRQRYQGTPRNILRHIVISDVKEALVQLPVEVRDAAILAHDPLPPLDSRESYERPERDRHRQGNDSFFGAFLRSLLPTYDPNAPPVEDVDAGAAAAAEGGAGVRVEFQRSVNHLLEAMRDLLNNIQPAALPAEVHRQGDENREGADEENEDAWAEERDE